MYLLYEILEHGFGDFEVGYNAIFEGSYRDDTSRRFPEHPFCFLSHGDNPFCPALVLVDGDNGRLVRNYALSFQIDQCVSGTKIYCEVF